MSSVVVKAQPQKPQRILSEKSKLNEKHECLKQQEKELKQSIPKVQHSLSESHSIEPNSSGVILLQCESKSLPLINLVCCDSFGGLSHYIVSPDDAKIVKVFVENLLDVQRDVKLSYFLID